jgi:hypothetical protein
VSAVLGSSGFEEGLARYLYERSEEARAVRVGEKEVSEQAAIVARHAALFTESQLATLRAEEHDEPEGEARERLARLRLTCEHGIVERELAAREDALENRLLAARVPWDGEELPLRTAQARLATTTVYAQRDELGAATLAVSASFNEERRALLAAGEALEAELSAIPGAVARSEAQKGVHLQPILDAVDRARVESTPVYVAEREHWLERLLGDEREERPSFAHVPWLRRLSPLEETYTRERAVPVCTRTVRELGLDVEAEPGIRLDLEDRPQKSPRACVIPSDPPRVVHLITRAQGGVHDYHALLHEAGHALHYAGCDPSLPVAFRHLSRDHSLTEIYSFLLDSIVHEPAWHEEHFQLDRRTASDHARAARFVDALLFRRYSAKLSFELDFWSRFAGDGGTPDGYEERLTAATGIRYPQANYLADMDAGFYSADYLRAWIRAAQVRAWLRHEAGEVWWRAPRTGELLRELFREGTRPSSEDIAHRIGAEPLDVGPLVAELTAVVR